MKYRIEVQQVFGSNGKPFDTDAEWLEVDAKPRGLAAAKEALKAQVEKYKNGAPHRIVAISPAGFRAPVEVLTYESPLAKLIREDDEARAAIEKTDAVSQGREGYAAGLSLVHCNPFVEGSVLAQEWAQGWQAAQDEEWSAKALAEVEKAEAIARTATAGRVSGYYSFEVDGVEWSVRDADGMLWTRNGKRISRVNVLRQLAGLA